MAEAEALALLMKILWITLGLVVEVFIVIMSYVWFNPYRRAWFMSKISRKAYGVVEIAGKGNEITTHLANFYEDYATVRDGVFFLDPNRVYWKDGARVIHYDENNAFQAISYETKRTIGEALELSQKQLEKLTPSQQNAMIPVVERGYDQILRVYPEPADMRAKEKTSKDGVKESHFNPTMIKQIFLKQKAIAENDAWTKLMTTIKILIMLSIAGAAAAAAISYMNYDKLKVLAGV